MTTEADAVLSNDRWTANQIPSLAGRTFIVTGANSGLGYVTTRELARHGGHVIMAVRDEAKGKEALEELGERLPAANLELRHLDLSDLSSVKAFAQGIIADRMPVHVLINNAGIMMPPRSLTRQGFELQFGVNHLAHFALTGLLLKTLAVGSDARVVTVSSNAHKKGFIHFDDLTGERKYGGWEFYCQSKFANTVFALELDRRLRASGVPVKSILAHPGYSATNLQSSGPSGVLKLVMRLTNKCIAQNVDTGTLPQLYASTDSKAEGGQFIGPDGHGESKGYPTIVQPVETAKNPNTAKRLWDISEELTGVHFGLGAVSEIKRQQVRRMVLET
ncbi:MAG: short-chain dehydrogenase [Betaproteobacteria bacterium]|nr:short-chain dehydrogenase [Betaproteobacteria bacterium]